MDKKYTRHEQTIPDEEGNDETVYVLEANVATRRGRAGARCDMCDVCGESFSAYDIKYFRGVSYGVPCGCYKDIVSILRKEAAERYRPPTRPGKSERESTILYE
uniref:Uncharacterized protein n=1 Tax=viral metagenome TaxID=1070528 RepID=A0A6M3LQC5_9ZZZZ